MSRTVTKSHLDAGFKCLLQQRLIERSVIPPTSDQVVKRAAAAQRKPPPPIIESRTRGYRVVIERSFNAGGSKLVEYVLGCAPVLQALVVAVKSGADVSVPFADYDGATGARKRDGAGKTGGPGPDDCHGIASRPLMSAAFRHAHFAPHGSKT
jgi:hypothetical protein